MLHARVFALAQHCRVLATSPFAVTMKQIVSRDNPGYKALKVLAEDSREQRLQRRTLLDGIHLIEAFRDKVGAPLRLVVSEYGAAQAEVRALLDTLPTVDVWLLRDNLFKAISEVASPVGIIAIIATPEPLEAAVASGSCVLLDGVQDAGNVGSILRTAAAADIRDVFLGFGCAGAWTPRVLRAAQGAHFDLCIREQADLGKVMTEFSGVSVAGSAHGDKSLFDLTLSGPVAWLFGAEGRGIAPELEAAAGHRITIPLAAGSESLNVAAAAAICLFEEVRQRQWKEGL